MEEMQQAHHEIDLLQGIITRHEGHMFALRGWFLAIVGGLLAAYYTHIVINDFVLRIALLLVALLFLLVELQHVNLVEAVIERVTAIEKEIENSRRSTGQSAAGWYDGPRISETCRKGANRWWPGHGMTFVLNQPFYIVVILVILFITVLLPPKPEPMLPPVQTVQPAQK